MAKETGNKPKKFNKEYFFTMLMIFLIAGVAAAIVITFRIKMKPYQIKPENVEKQNESINTDKNAPQNEIK